MRTKTIHCIAQCEDCDWREEDYNTARERAYAHNRKTGHQVNGEVGYGFVYYRKTVQEK